MQVFLNVAWVSKLFLYKIQYKYIKEKYLQFSAVIVQ